MKIMLRTNFSRALFFSFSSLFLAGVAEGAETCSQMKAHLDSLISRSNSLKKKASSFSSCSKNELKYLHLRASVMGDIDAVTGMIVKSCPETPIDRAKASKNASLGRDIRAYMQGCGIVNEFDGL
jgi:hypothetical protein